MYQPQARGCCAFRRSEWVLHVAALGIAFVEGVGLRLALGPVESGRLVGRPGSHVAVAIVGGGGTRRRLVELEAHLANVVGGAKGDARFDLEVVPEEGVDGDVANLLHVHGLERLLEVELAAVVRERRLRRLVDGASEVGDGHAVLAELGADAGLQRVEGHRGGSGARVDLRGRCGERSTGG